MTRALKALAFCGLICTAQAQAVDEATWRRCREIVDAAARLACYDAMPLAPAPLPMVRPAADPRAFPAPPLPMPAGAGFGLEPPGRELAEITSRISGHFEGWGPRSRILLANGQVWQVSDDSSGVYDLTDPKVTVRRAALGSFMLEIEGARRAPRVRRIE